MSTNGSTGQRCLGDIAVAFPNGIAARLYLVCKVVGWRAIFSSGCKVDPTYLYSAFWFLPLHPNRIAARRYHK